MPHADETSTVDTQYKSRTRRPGRRPARDPARCAGSAAARLGFPSVRVRLLHSLTCTALLRVWCTAAAVALAFCRASGSHGKRRAENVTKRTRDRKSNKTIAPHQLLAPCLVPVLTHTTGTGGSTCLHTTIEKQCAAHDAHAARATAHTGHTTTRHNNKPKLISTTATRLWHTRCMQSPHRVARPFTNRYPSTRGSRIHDPTHPWLASCFASMTGPHVLARDPH